ncbi:MAG: hypothetical protein V8S58_12770, partial [Lachnospiraceae bacterium]
MILAVCICKASREKLPNYSVGYGGYAAALLALSVVGKCSKQVAFAMKFTSVPIVPLILTALFGLIVNAILKTKLGQDFAIAMNMKVAAASGIDVDKTRIIAIILSTIMASWGQIIFLQKIGNFTTYSAMRKSGIFAGSSIFGGSASAPRNG